MEKSNDLGTKSIGSLLAAQSIPAAIGFMIMSLNMVVDTIFVGQNIGKLAIGAISVVMPITFLMASFGMAIGIGGSSIVARAFGSKNNEKAQLTFNNQLSLSLTCIFVLTSIALIFQDQILFLFGGVGELVALTKTYYIITLIGVPFLTLAMTINGNLRAEGKPKVAMMVLVIPSIVNIILDYIFIILLDWGMEGAAWATTFAYFSSGLFLIFYFLSGKTELKVDINKFKFDKAIIIEIVSLGMVNLLRQGAISILTIVLNHSLFYYGNNAGIGGETAISIYGIPNRIAMFAFFPLIGIAQGFVPIAGFNFGSGEFERVKEVVNLAIKWGFMIATILTVSLLLGADYIPLVFASADEIDLIKHTPDAIFIIFFATPLVVFQLIGSSYYQAIGKALPATLLTLTKQFFFLTPLILIFPIFFGFKGIWYAFPTADILSSAVCYYFLKIGMKNLS
jgi:putative MATE family efflux protein